MESATNGVTACRCSTYKLPKAKAEALAAFLREHMKASVEVSVKDEDGRTSLVVTVSPED